MRSVFAGTLMSLAFAVHQQGFKKKLQRIPFASGFHPEAAKIEHGAYFSHVCYFSHILPMRPTEAECIWGSGARFPAGLWTRDVSRGKTQFHLVNHLEHFFQTIDVHADLAGHRHQDESPVGITPP